MNIDGRRKSQVGPLPDTPLSCWQKLDNYVWLGAHQYFYICCIHEYGGPNCIRTSPNMLILLRLILLITISALVALNIIDKKEEKLKFTIFSIYISFVVSVFQVLAILKYKTLLKEFKLKIIQSKQTTVNNLLIQIKAQEPVVNTRIGSDPAVNN
jgi:hypothetical protein